MERRLHDLLTREFARFRFHSAVKTLKGCTARIRSIAAEQAREGEDPAAVAASAESPAGSAMQARSRRRARGRRGSVAVVGRARASLQEVPGFGAAERPVSPSSDPGAGGITGSGADADKEPQPGAGAGAEVAAVRGAVSLQQFERDAGLSSERCAARAKKRFARARKAETLEAALDAAIEKQRSRLRREVQGALTDGS